MSRTKFGPSVLMIFPGRESGRRSDANPAETTMTPELQKATTTGSAQEDGLATDQGVLSNRRWAEVIDKKLIEWGQRPQELEDVNLIPPTSCSVAAASKLVYRLRDRKAPPPMSVVPDGDGGIVLERWNESHSESFEISKHGVIELVELDHHCVTSRIVIVMDRTDHVAGR